MDKGNGMGTWPVQLDWYADGDHSIIDTKPDAKCMVEQVASVYSENHEDYAKLFAAAPDLLEACKAMCAPDQTPESIDAAFVLMRAAIKKANQ